MKKLYSAPLMEIEIFDVQDVITTSGQIVNDKSDNSETTATYEVLVETQW